MSQPSEILLKQREGCRCATSFSRWDSRRVSVLVIALLCSDLSCKNWSGTTAESAVDDSPATMVPSVLARQREVNVLPIYPEESEAAGRSGLCVAQYLIDSTGTVVSVRMLEAPDKFIARSAESAIYQWRFRPVKVGARAVRISAKAIFYFRLIDGRGRVFEATDVDPESTDK